jgi:hypothetical protein
MRRGCWTDGGIGAEGIGEFGRAGFIREEEGDLTRG